MKYALTLALMTGCLAASPIAASASDTTTTTVRIDVGSLDLASPDGANTAERRIGRAVHQSCRNDVEHLTHRARRAARECRDTLRDLAMQKLRAQGQQQLAAQ